VLVVLLGVFVRSCRSLASAPSWYDFGYPVRQHFCLIPLLHISRGNRHNTCMPSHRVAVVVALSIRSGFALRSAIALASPPPLTSKAPRRNHQKLICTYHQQVRILKPLSRCLSGGLESRCAAAVNSASLGYVSSARSSLRVSSIRAAVDGYIVLHTVCLLTQNTGRTGGLRCSHLRHATIDVCFGSTGPSCMLPFILRSTVWT
jgi:hypothetical protein